MTERLYYVEPYRTRFTAQVVEQLVWEEHPAVILNRTAFYPTSGGQPADRGILDNTTVLDVIERPTDGAVVHVLSNAIATGQVEGEIAWQRRFDHMQQHTGQHVLSAVFEQILHAETVGFHLGAESSTIDVDLPDLELEDALPVEALANEIVWDDRPVGIRFVDGDTVANMPSVEPPPDVEGPVRLVEIPSRAADSSTARSSATADQIPLDVNPCGGTHVSRTGEIGMIKLVGLEHRGSKTRIEFLCGGRALRDYEAKRQMTDTLAGMLTVGTWELDEAVERLRAENKHMRHVERELRQRLLDMESAQLVETATVHGPYRVVAAVWQQRSPQELRTLARKLVEHDDLVALLFSVPVASSLHASERTHFSFARAEDLDLDVNQLLQKACARLGGKGGGRPQVAQGSAPSASMNEVDTILRDLQAGLELEA